MGRNVRRHSHHQAPRGRWPLPFSKGASSDRGAVLAVQPGAARALGGSPGGGRERVRPRCALEGVPAGRARNKGWMMSNHLLGSAELGSQRWHMVSSAAYRPAMEADGRDSCNLRRIGASSLSTSHHRQQSRRHAATGQLSCSSGSAPFRCWMSEHRGPAAITAARSQEGAPHCLLRAATRFYMRHSAQLQANPTASKAPERLCAAEEE